MRLFPCTQCETGVIDRCTAAQNCTQTDIAFTVTSPKQPQMTVPLTTFHQTCRILMNIICDIATRVYLDLSLNKLTT